MKKLALIVSCATLVGCAATPDNIASFSTAELCRSYIAPISPNYMSPLVRNELVNRGAGQCVDPNYVAAMQAQNAQLLMFGTGMIIQNQPQPMYAPPPPAPPTVNCRIIPNPYGDRVVCQ
jgi:hypothetical protein